MEFCFNAIVPAWHGAGREGRLTPGQAAVQSSFEPNRYHCHSKPREDRQGPPPRRSPRHFVW